MQLLVQGAVKNRADIAVVPESVVDACNKENCTPLMLAVEAGNEVVARGLVAYGARLRYNRWFQDISHHTVLKHARH